tara:strand:+ start:1757 stop:2086 length:330 start_codon:yes stop_codon:yes gene_type:complete
MIYDQGLKDICALTDIDIFTSLISGAAHDMDHPGTNNVFETKTRSKLALLYNDSAVLENHHTASFFFLLENIQQECNILANFSQADIDSIRKSIIENIMCTDMSKHPSI